MDHKLFMVVVFYKQFFFVLNWASRRAAMPLILSSLLSEKGASLNRLNVNRQLRAFTFY